MSKMTDWNTALKKSEEIFTKIKNEELYLIVWNAEFSRAFTYKCKVIRVNPFQFPDSQEFEFNVILEDENGTFNHAIEYSKFCSKLK